MQTDMHYYGTYAIARAAGLKPKDAKIIAYSAQFVDDSTQEDSLMHEDGGLLYGVATAHHPFKQVPLNYLHYLIKNYCYNWLYKSTKKKKLANLQQRRIWIPFHFYPGNQTHSNKNNEKLSHQLICRKDSDIVNAMFKSHTDQIKSFPYILHLIGIASHVYMDTFSHYGFSGVSSTNNKIYETSFKFYSNDESKSINSSNKIKEFKKFKLKYSKETFVNNWRKVTGCLQSKVATLGSGALGHGSVASFPDQPYLKWSFEYEKTGQLSERNNPETFLEGCEKLHSKLKDFSKNYYSEEPKITEFSKIKETIKEILLYESDKTEERIEQWLDAINKNKLFTKANEEFLDYDNKEWENQKIEKFAELETSSKVVTLDIYKFHQAADYHRHYTLKQLLPKYGIIVN